MPCRGAGVFRDVAGDRTEVKSVQDSADRGQNSSLTEASFHDKMTAPAENPGTGEAGKNLRREGQRARREDWNRMLELKNVSFRVNAEGQDKEIIRDVSLTLPDGRLTVITGPNGGGKSTLARLIAGIEKPDSGQILLNGQDITGWSITERARAGIAFAFQQPVRFKGLQVLDLIRLAAGKTLSVSEACTFLVKVGLCARDYLDREVNASLSGGELKRIEIEIGRASCRERV